MNKNRLVHPGFWFGKTRREDALELARLGVGGFCIYGGNSHEVRELITDLRAASPLPYLIISADYEDGLGRWLPDAALLPSNMAVGASRSEELAFEKGRLTAEQARSLGVDWVFAPVLDLADTPANPIVNTRAFSDEPDLVAPLARALMNGLAEGGALHCLKHFLGHGATETDSHLALPVLQRTAEQLKTHELLPFEQLLPEADAVMIGHLFVSELDEKWPASQSANIINGVLVNRMGWKGCVVTDALCMKAIGDEKDASRRALSAGAHILLSCEKPFELLSYLDAQTDLDELTLAALQQQDALILRLKERAKPAATVNLRDHSLADRYAARCLTALGVLPFFKPGDEVCYLELGNEENYVAADFLQTLERAGLKILPFKNEAERLIVTSFSNYKAFKGRVNLNDAEKERLASALAVCPQATLVSFGNPFCFAGFTAKAAAALFAFSPCASFQKAAANALTGKLFPTGKMPVHNAE